MKKLLRLLLITSVMLTVFPQESDYEDETYSDTDYDLFSDTDDGGYTDDSGYYADDSGSDAFSSSFFQESDDEKDSEQESSEEVEKPKKVEPPKWIDGEDLAKGVDASGDTVTSSQADDEDLEVSEDAVSEDLFEDQEVVGGGDSDEGDSDEGDVSLKQESDVSSESEQEAIEPEEELDPEDEDVMGIDTTDLEEPQGNWLYKRLWWEKAEGKYEKIRATVTKLFEMRTNFFVKRSELDKNVLDPFYIKIGMQRGELQAMLTGMIDTLKEQEENADNQAAASDDDDDQEAQEVDSLEQIKEKRVALESLAQEVDNILKSDGAVDSAILKLVEQMNRLRTYEQQAWQDFKDLARVLNDKKARELYYKVDGAWRNIKEIQQYLEQAYSDSFDKLIKKVNAQVEQVQMAMDSLQQMGVGLKNKIAQELAASQEGSDEQDEQEQEKNPSMIHRFIINPVYSLANGVGSVFGTVWSKIVSFATWPFAQTEAESFEDEDGLSSNASQIEEIDLEMVEDRVDDEQASSQEPVDLAQEIARDDQEKKQVKVPANTPLEVQDEVVGEALNPDAVTEQEEVAIQE